jgi:hypothetical protein
VRHRINSQRMFARISAAHPSKWGIAYRTASS